MAKRRARRRRTAPVPEAVEVRMYNVGLGDCFLLTFHYSGGGAKRVLIDFGSVGKNADGPSLAVAAERIADDCGGTLDAVVATHRHRDHLAGFSGSAGELLEEKVSAPQLIVQPWTEDPKLDNDSLADAAVPAGTRGRSRALGARERTRITMAQSVSDAFLHEAWLRRRHPRRGDDLLRGYAAKNASDDAATLFEDVPEDEHEDLSDWLGTDRLTNFEAIKRLASWGEAKNEYLAQGDRTKLGEVVPGLEVDVLGPAGPEDWESLHGSGSSSELWFRLQAYRGGGGPFQVLSYQPGAERTRGVRVLFERHVDDGSGRFEDNVRWLKRRMDDLRTEQALGFVRALDSHLNNTSLVLLMRFGGFTMLFPGDAEVASWMQIAGRGSAADRRAFRDSLKTVDPYKVGHHASNNATPKASLWEGLMEGRTEPLHCLVSTQPTRFSGSIPAPRLSDELRSRSVSGDGGTPTVAVASTLDLFAVAAPQDDGWSRDTKVSRGRATTFSLSRTFECRSPA